MNLSIRPAVLEDYEALCAIFGQVDALHCEALPQVFQEPDGPARSGPDRHPGDGPGGGRGGRGGDR